MRVHRFSGEALRDRRRSSGLKPEPLAVAANRCAAVIYQYERGEADPPASVVARLAGLLGCDPGDLFVEVDQ